MKPNTKIFDYFSSRILDNTGFLLKKAVDCWKDRDIDERHEYSIDSFYAYNQKRLEFIIDREVLFIDIMKRIDEDRE